MEHPQIQVLDQGYVQLIETWGSDQRIVESARMSTNKGFLGWEPRHSDHCQDMSRSNWLDGCICKPKSDLDLLRYLWEHKHTTPFEMAGFTIEVQAPLMVFREWHRHRTQSYSEMSGRYVELPKLAYIPSLERLMAGGQSKSNKQASGAQMTEHQAQQARDTIWYSYESAWDDYTELLVAGFAKELARLVLPVNQYSRMRATANLWNWLHFLQLRLAEGAQWEIRQYAGVVAGLVKELYPRTYQLFEEGL